MTTQKTDQKAEQVMKEVFILDPGLNIHPARVPLKEWNSESGYFLATTTGGREMIAIRSEMIALQGNWKENTTFIGFETEKEAEKFRNEKSSSNHHRLPHR